ncbi:MAG: hypothetical protein HOP18_09015, partial [Deltaproteobacteria bacterium]|nr:hypothetical protein [Deltaproteobacteria bacterium]
MSTAFSHRYWQERLHQCATRVALKSGLTVFLLLCLSQLAAAQGTFSPTGSMLFERTFFTLTRLADGRVLAAGANGAGNVGVNTAEVYNPTTGTWSFTGSMKIPRGFHTATLLKNGKVLVVGGSNYSPQLAYLSSAELYDPVTGTWSLTGSMSVPRQWHMAFPLKDGRVLVTGGYFLQRSSEIYDPQTGQWSPTGSMVNGRYLFDGVVLLDGRVLVAGGIFGSELAAEIYDPTTGQWSSTGPLNYPRGAYYSLTRLADGRVLLAGGANNGISQVYNQAEIFDPVAGVWTPTTFMPRARYGHSAVLLLDGTVLVTGGTAVGGANAFIFNPVSQTWTEVAGTFPSINLATRLLDGRVLVAGGTFNGFATAQAFLFTGGTGTVLPLLKLDVSAPLALAVVNGSYTPNPFTITATLTNTGAVTAQNVELSLSLPQGITLTEGSVTQVIADVPAGQQRQVVWSVQAAGQAQDVTLSYLVTAVLPNRTGKTVSGQITLPGGALTIGAITPKAGGDTGSVTVHVNGGGFLDGATVKLVRDGEFDILGNAVSVATDGFSAAARFDLTGKPRGLWSVVVTNPNGTAGMLTDAFTVEEGRAADVWVEVIGPSSVTMGSPSTFYIVYGNRGNVDAMGVPIVIGGVPTGAIWSLGFNITPPPTQQALQFLTPSQALQSLDLSDTPFHIETSGGTIAVPLEVPISAGNTGMLPITISSRISFALNVKAWPSLSDILCSDAVGCVNGIIEALTETLEAGFPVLGAIDCLKDFYCLSQQASFGNNLVRSLVWDAADLLLSCAGTLLPIEKARKAALLIASTLITCVKALLDVELPVTAIDPQAGGGG